MIPREVLEKVRRIEIRTRSVVESILSGEYHSVFKGRGMEFSEVRQYIEGDDIRAIDWNVTARMGGPYVKKYVEERELTVMVVVDASASGDFGTVGRFKAEMAVELCAMLAFSAIKNNDRVGLIIFTNEIEAYIPPKKGKNHVLRVIRELLYFRPRNRGTDIGQALSFLTRVLKKKAVVFVVSDFFAAGYETPMRVAASRHDLIALSLADPRERSIPDIGLTELEDPETGEVLLVNTSSGSFRNAFSAAMEARARKRTTFFKANNIDEIVISTDVDYVEPLVKFFKKRERIHA